MSNEHRELPPVNMGHSVDEFFEHLAETSGQGAKLPNWWVSSLSISCALADLWGDVVGMGSCTLKYDLVWLTYMHGMLTRPTVPSRNIHVSW